MKKTELLCPAGSLKTLKFAAAYGADAVYAGQPRYSLRVRNNEFDLEHLKEGIDFLHQLKKKFYAVVNIQPHSAKLHTFVDDIKELASLGPDSFIMSDPGLIMLAREALPDMPIHLSVQANTCNYAAVKFWAAHGISRVILSRELSIDEIKEIRDACPDTELEVFVHGALCVAYSGRCLLSGYLNRRDANQGACTNACRWNYGIQAAREDSEGNFVPDLETGPATKQSCLITAPGRENAPMPADEDEHGTYIMNSKDLCALPLIKKLCDIGVDSLKIEGRTKSFYYCARAASVYRRAINDAVSGKEPGEDLYHDINRLSNRGYTTGFLDRHQAGSTQNYADGRSITDGSQIAGEFIERISPSLIKIAVRNKFAKGDLIELLTPEGSSTFKITDLRDKHGEATDVAPGDGHIVEVGIPEEFQNRNFNEYTILVRCPVSEGANN